ncbi:hypothetical protein H8M03_00070 [Sphingomonas sabuli]|uniref:Uncharacterized protein n=1 Tax=Sphingomonas sabuli TaxID=2764186 RepID=A0A7G9L2G3_9SPHN|nr:phage tail protein [Sphingomonas sabuli]QNM82812.1 hypothetical protein H8M03_00070 [Sphingomonas sabuli]
MGDLAVQTSSYGTPIPKIFGTMRVAGSIVWSTDLVEQSETVAAKGQPDSVSYSCTVSFAVALSARRIRDVRRIWADGQLIRTAEGELSVGATLRLLDGSEDQAVDPLIASVEGIGATPAYRGLALAVFEDMELASFGNRIPFLTFEVDADGEPIGVDTILFDASDGAIVTSGQPSIGGYAAHGPSIAAAVSPLVAIFQPNLTDDGDAISDVAEQAQSVESAELGCSVEGGKIARLERSTARARSLPSSVTLAYYDAARDYQAGAARSATEGIGGAPERTELPAVVDASSAKAIVATHLARRWAQRDRLQICLPPKRMAVRPGTIVDLAGQGRWRVDVATLDGLVAKLELTPVYSSLAPIPGDSGRALTSTAKLLAPTRLELIELPAFDGSNATLPVVVAAASGKSVPMEIAIGGRTVVSRTAPVPAVLGSVLSPPDPASSALFDLRNSVDVQIDDHQHWLESRDDDALASGANLAVVGIEIMQFGTATPLGDGRFRLGRLLRGRFGTEWACGEHGAGEPFVLLDRNRLVPLPLTAQDLGAVVEAVPAGRADGDAQPTRLTVFGDALRPPSPVHLRAERGTDGTLACTWVRRSAAGWAWLDEVDAPLGSAVERYRATLRGPGGAVTVEISLPLATFNADQVAAVGAGAADIVVVQIGDLALSRPAILRVTL